jgi:hypothetical protein
MAHWLVSPSVPPLIVQLVRYPATFPPAVCARVAVAVIHHVPDGTASFVTL